LATVVATGNFGSVFKSGLLWFDWARAGEMMMSVGDLGGDADFVADVAVLAVGMAIRVVAVPEATSLAGDLVAGPPPGMLPCFSLIEP
jgi:hypothetical protein